MDKAEFDKFADEYESVHARNIAISGETPDYFAKYKMKDLAAEYFAHRGDRGSAPAVLDFGSGIGTSVPFVRMYFPHCNLTCLDVSNRSLEIGRNHFGAYATFVVFDGSSMPFPDASFDIAYAACVFHHIDHAEHVALLGELRRVLVPGGMLAVFEHNPYNPLTVKTVNECPFDENARLIPAPTMRRRVLEAGFHSTRIRYRIFFPRALRAFRPMEKRMTWLPLGAQYYTLAVK
jgi:ubiquinone/menaquinone biosynthesis C-methylase UbiE